ncbi:CcdB family protein [Desulfuromonas carbonis]|uniref:CcdB family protein n=1 Tax=Desulfuromonas sp. DDH964 TaxID=1823759 RepID=UPI00078D7ABD|nr:CcdB family protein [Desulfuromonas sp. DDH964]AMV73071.1 plasmid maintenance protein CcdB [Desulfuromonas sp. DDH964]
MAQFDVHRNPDPASKRQVPYLLDIQADLLSGLATRVVVPLLTAASIAHPLQILNPAFTVEGTRVILSTPELAGIARSELGETVATLAAERDTIIAALDLLLTGA